MSGEQSNGSTGEVSSHNSQDRSTSPHSPPIPRSPPSPLATIDVPSPFDDVNQSEPIENASETTHESSGMIFVGSLASAMGNNENTGTEGLEIPAASPRDNDIHFRVMPATLTPPPPPQRPQRASIRQQHCCQQLVLVLTYPCTVIVSIIGIIVVLIFCVFPTLLFMGLVIGCYYCFSSDPLPLSVLIQDLLVSHNPSRNTNSRFSNAGVVDPEQTKADRAFYRSTLIVRKLLEVERVPLSCTKVPMPTSPHNDIGESNNGSCSKVIDHRTNVPKTTIETDSDFNFFDKSLLKIIDNVHLRKHNGPIEIWTDHTILRFSKLLEAPIEDSNNGEKEKAKEPRVESDSRSLSESDIEAPELVPHYQRSSEIELSSGHLQESSPPARTAVLPSSEHDQAPSETSIHLDNCNGMSQSDSSACRNDDEPADVNISLGERSGTESVTDEKVSSPDTDYFGIEDDARDAGTACDICILEFEAGDEIAWSPNLNCSHAFHKDCILDWLVRKPTCPNCRQDYVPTKSDETEYS